MASRASACHLLSMSQSGSGEDDDRFQSHLFHEPVERYKVRNFTKAASCSVKCQVPPCDYTSIRKKERKIWHKVQLSETNSVPVASSLKPKSEECNPIIIPNSSLKFRMQQTLWFV